MLINPYVLFFFVFANLTIFCCCIGITAMVIPRSSLASKSSRIGSTLFFAAIGFTHLDVTLLVLFTQYATLGNLNATWHLLLLRLVTAIGVVLFCFGLYIDSADWRQRRHTRAATRLDPADLSSWSKDDEPPWVGPTSGPDT